MTASRQTLLTCLGLALLWEIAGDFDLVARGALPSPSEIAVQFWADRGDYPGHMKATLWTALAGFVAGNAVAIIAAVAFVLSPPLERLLRGINITLFAVPSIALVPILVIAFVDPMPRILLAALSVYFPTMIAMLVGLRQIDPRLVDVVHAYAGGDWGLLRWVRLRSSLPALLGGLRIAAPAAVLGAILAEYGGGVRWGLGTYLLGSLGQGNPARLWGIGLTATLISGLAYAVFAWLAWRSTGTTASVTLAAGAAPDRLGRTGPGGRLAQIVIGAAAVVIVLAVWTLALKALNISPVVAKSPLGVWSYLTSSSRAEEARAALIAAAAATVPMSLLGLAVGLAFAFGLAILGTVWSGLGRALLPVCLVTQTMPLVALTPLIALLLGRGVAATLAITVSVSFFPSFVILAQGLALVPARALDLLRAYGASKAAQLRFVSIPSALPYVFAAARLAAPRAMLGAMIAEWLTTGRGLGGLLNRSRGYSDYGMIWSVAAFSVVIAILLYYAIAAVERPVLRRFAAAEG